LKPFNAIKNIFRNLTVNNLYTGRDSLATWSPNHLHGKLTSDSYATIHPSVRAISDEFMQIKPYAIDKTGKTVKSMAVDALYHPNKIDSSASFFKKLAVSKLTHRKTYLLVWRKNGSKAVPFGDITPNNIAGYTFLEHPSVSTVLGKTIYTLGSSSFTEDEVIVIPGGVNPDNLYGGYSSREAAERWAKLDDYIAAFQAGFFENGAIPAGTFVITTAKKTDYEDTVTEMQKAHRGAGKNGNVVYTPRPIDKNTGKEAHAQIEWIPFAQSNKDIDFKNLFEQTNKRTDMAFGVSQVVKGVDDASTYATAQVSEAGFAKRAVRPMAIEIYTTITHELNRITNGLGYAIVFDYAIPAVADAVKVESETKVLNQSIITNMVDLNGYSLESVVDAFELPESYKKLKKVETATIKEIDEGDVDEGGEVNASPDPKQIETFVNQLHDGGCGCQNPKAVVETVEYNEIKKAAARFMQTQVDKAVDEVDDETKNEQGDYDNNDLETFVDDALIPITALLIADGTIQYEEGIQLILDAGLNADMLSEFSLTDAEINNYKSYLTNVGKSYASDTKDAIRKVLDNGNANGLSASQLKKELKTIPNLEEWRTVRIARTETVRAGGNGSLFAMENIQGETGYAINKIWNTYGGNPCEFCRAMDGTVVSVNTPFVPKDGVIQGEDGGVLNNDFVDMDIAHSHPNCQCGATWEIVK